MQAMAFASRSESNKQIKSLTMMKMIQFCKYLLLLAYLCVANEFGQVKLDCRFAFCLQMFDLIVLSSLFVAVTAFDFGSRSRIIMNAYVNLSVVIDQLEIKSDGDEVGREPFMFRLYDQNVDIMTRTTVSSTGTANVKASLSPAAANQCFSINSPGTMTLCDIS